MACTPPCCMQGLSMHRIVHTMAERSALTSVEFDFVLVAGHFLARDENIFTYFEGHKVRLPNNHGEAAPASVLQY